MLYLASKSPRRKELVAELGLPFEIIESPAPEKLIEQRWREEGRPGGTRTLAERLAAGKAAAVLELLERDGRAEDAVVLAADTLVVLDERILHKPADREDARETLRTLAGREHSVLTSCCLLSPEQSDVFVSETKVTFFPMDAAMEAEIERYIATDGPYDKANGYGIQEQGKFLVKKIDGDYLTVVGLPLAELKRRLVNFL